jgi:hypothetical protein
MPTQKIELLNADTINNIAAESTISEFICNGLCSPQNRPKCFLASSFESKHSGLEDIESIALSKGLNLETSL